MISVRRAVYPARTGTPMFEVILYTITDYRRDSKTGVCGVDERAVQALAVIYPETIYTPVLISPV